MSYGKFSHRQRSMRFRAEFPAIWAGFLHANFESVEHAAFAFGVDASTARKWWGGEHSPGGAFVAYAFEILPDQAWSMLLKCIISFGATYSPPTYHGVGEGCSHGAVCKNVAVMSSVAKALLGWVSCGNSENGARGGETPQTVSERTRSNRSRFRRTARMCAAANCLNLPGLRAVAF